MNEAKLVDQYTANSALYQLSTPLEFHAQNEGNFLQYDRFESDKVVICQCSVGGQLRTVIHAATQLQGDGGVCYGARWFRIYDCYLSLEDALKLNGYKVVS